MADRPRLGPVDHRALAEMLAALSYPARLELLEALRLPHAFGDIRITALRSITAAGEPERPAARSTVQGHLEKLEQAGLVRTQEVDRDGRAVKMYMANALKLYMLLEDLRRVVVLHAGHTLAGEATGTLQGSPPASRATGPRLVLVHGLYEGRAYALDASTREGERWTIGRRKGLPISLDYDPYASLEHAFIARQAQRFVLTDFADSKNGTHVNWAPLPKGGSVTLRAADIIGVGRSLLSFVPE